MGIKHFFMWFKNHYSEHMRSMRKGDTLHTVGAEIDNLMIEIGRAHV